MEDLASSRECDLKKTMEILKFSIFNYFYTFLQVFRYFYSYFPIFYSYFTIFYSYFHIFHIFSYFLRGPGPQNIFGGPMGPPIYFFLNSLSPPARFTFFFDFNAFFNFSDAFFGENLVVVFRFFYSCSILLQIPDCMVFGIFEYKSIIS